MDRRRRQTLSVLNANTQGRRPSNGRMSMGMKRQSSMGTRTSYGAAPQSVLRKNSRSRFSLGPAQHRQSVSRRSMAGRQSMSRRQSVFGGKGKVADPRPIGDKRFQQENIRTLITFLTSHNYEHPLSPKLLTAPSTRDFKKILEFLFSLLDPMWPSFVDEKNFEQEAVGMMTMLGFPFTITKSSLKTPGSPHTWPTMLASLVWVIELISYTEIVEDMEAKQLDEDSGLGGGEENSEKLFFDFLSRAYSDFLQGDDDGAEVHAELKAQFDARNEGVNTAIAHFQTDNDRLEKEINALKSTQNELTELKNQRTDLNLDLTKFTQLNEKLDQHIKTLTTKLDERQTEMQQVEEQLTEAQCETETLEETIRDQPISPQEVQRMVRERTLLEQSESSLSTQKETLQQDCWALEMSIAKRCEEVKAAVQQFNSSARQACLIPKHGKNAGGVDFKLKFDESVTTGPLDMIRPHLKAEVKPKLLAIAQDFQDRVRVTNEELRELEDKQRSLESLEGEKQERVHEVKAQLTKVQDAFSAARDSYNAEIQGVLAEVEETEANIVTLKRSHRNAMKASQTELQELDFEATQQQELFDSQCKAMKEEIDSLLDKLTKSKMAVSQAISEMEDVATSAEATVQAAMDS